ncbi:MAG: methyltransferase [Pseudomonadota bacterium]|nr:methyltransferase [Pseudomonadota bacterium]
MKLRLATAAAALALVVTSGVPALAQVAPAAAVADASRPAADTAKDASRKPADMIAFAKVKAGDHVMDVWTGSGYWARLFSKVVGPKGKVYAYVPAEIAGFKSKPVDMAKAMAAEPGLGNVEAISDPVASQPPLQFQNILDVAWIFENYHDLHDDFMKQADGKLVDVDAVNTAMFKLLKPGGYYVIVDHAAPAGAGLTTTNTTHRIEAATLRAEVEKAGFKFDGESKVLANPADPHDKGVFDPSIKGKTDRFAYRFVKPKA